MSVEGGELDSRSMAAVRPGPIFVGGTGRSGTTVMVRILGQHTRIHALKWESQFIVAPNGLIDVLRTGCGESEVDEFVQRLKGRWYRRTINPGKPNEYEAGLVSDVEENELDRSLEYFLTHLPTSHTHEDRVRLAGRFANRLFAGSMRRSGALRWCEKTPRNLLLMDQLLELFPRMRIINMVRDGRDVVASMLDRGFWPIAAGHEFPELASYQGRMTFDRAVRYWVDVLDIAHRLESTMPNRAYCKVRLEELLARPQEVLRSICAFLGEEFEPQLLERDLSKGRTGRWKDTFTSNQLRLFWDIAGPTMEREGYSRREVE